MWRAALILDQVLRNLAMALPPVARWRARRGRTSCAAGGIDQTYLDVHAYGPFALLEEAVGEGGIAGMDVGEVGPGDHLATALLVLGAGAESYVAFDRFAGDVEGSFARQVYEALYDSLDRLRPDLRRRLESRGIDAIGFPGSAGKALRRVGGAIEELEAGRSPGLDLLFSNYVVEHLSAVGRFARVSFDLLRPGGMAVHRIDLGPHDVWRKREDPFDWLIPSDRVWRWMTSRRGAPNRLRHHEIRERMLAAGFVIEDRVTERYEITDVLAARPKLARRFRDAPPDSLSAKTFVMICRKPG